MPRRRRFSRRQDRRPTVPSLGMNKNESAPSSRTGRFRFVRGGRLRERRSPFSVLGAHHAADLVRRDHGGRLLVLEELVVVEPFAAVRLQQGDEP